MPRFYRTPSFAVKHFTRYVLPIVFGCLVVFTVTLHSGIVAGSRKVNSLTTDHGNHIFDSEGRISVGTTIRVYGSSVRAEQAPLLPRHQLPPLSRDAFKQLTESGEIANYPPRTPEEALLRLVWTAGIQPGILRILIQEFYREWGDRCPQDLDWVEQPLSYERWRDLVRNGDLVNFPPKTMDEVMVRVGWISGYVGPRRGTEVAQVYSGYYSRGFRGACAEPNETATQRESFRQFVAQVRREIGASNAQSIRLDAHQVNIGGRWAGITTVSTAAMRGGGCVGERLRAADVPIRNELVLDLNQSGAHVAGIQQAFSTAGGDEPIANSCEFMGIVVGNRVHGTVCGGTTENIGVIAECGLEGWSIDWEPITFSATVTENRMDATIEEVGIVRSNTASYGISSSEKLTLQR